MQLRRAPNHCLEVHHFAPQIPNNFEPREITRDTLHEERLRNTQIHTNTQASVMGQEWTRVDTPETAYETDLLVDGIVLGEAVATQRTN